MPETPPSRSPRHSPRDRWRLLVEIRRYAEQPMIVLALVWLALMIVEYTRGLSPWLAAVNYGIWGVFIAEFLLRLAIAPRAGVFLRHNWVEAAALALPAVRVLRVFRAMRAMRVLGAARATRSLRLVRVLTSLNRGRGALARAIRKRGLGYVVAMTVAVTLGGAAGMLAFENPRALAEAGYVDEAAAGAGLESYGEAIWWTAMIMTSIGSEYWPVTVEGRVLCFLLSLYALAVFGYITASLAALFIGPTRERRDDLAQLRDEVATLRARLEEDPAADARP